MDVDVEDPVIPISAAVELPDCVVIANAEESAKGELICSCAVAVVDVD